MAGLSKYLSICLVVLLVVTSTTQLVVNAQSIPKPSMPEFNVTIIDSSYDIPPSSTVNPYNGQVTTDNGRHVESKTIQVSVKNQPFTPFSIKTNNGDRTVYLHYEVRWKGHFEKDWHQSYYPLDNYVALTVENAQLKTEYSEFLYKGDYSTAGWNGLGPTLPPDAQVDFQVKAFIGYVSWYQGAGASGWQFSGEESDWSNKKTINLSDGSVSVSPSPTSNPSPTVPELSWLVIVPLLLSLFSVAILVRHRKVKHE